MIFLKFRPCLFFIILKLNIICLNGDIDIEKHKKIIEDLPKLSDLDDYILFLDKTVNFVVEHKYYMDVNMNWAHLVFGVSVHQILKAKNETLPSNLVDRFDKWLRNYKIASDYFHANVAKLKKTHKFEANIFKASEVSREIRISYLHYNMSLWVPFEKFNLELLKRTTIYDRQQLENMYGRWITYANSIANVLMMVPSPDESDSCVGHLEHQPIFQSTLTNQAKCNVPKNCKLYLEAGSGFGYALLHRILLLVNSRFGRNCAIFSEKEDKYLTDKLCFMAYNENQYIALSDFAVPDLFGESIALCGLLGHAHFLTNFWVKSIMMHQKVDGCFMGDVSKSNEDFNEKIENETKQWSFSRDSDMLNGLCNKHMTSIALVVVTNVVRFITETYY